MKNKIIPLIILSSCLVGCATTTQQDIMQPATVQLKPVKTPGLSSVSINSVMTDSDRTKLQQVIETAKSDQHVTWNNENTKNSFDFVSASIYVNDKGQPCRDYTLTLNTTGFLHNSSKQVQATACRMDDMKWRVVNNQN